MNDPNLPPDAPMSDPNYHGSSLGPAPDHMIFAVISTILGTIFTMLACCCLPIGLPTGIVAIYQANKAKAFNAANNFDDAHKAAGQAKIWAIVTAVLAGLGLLLFLGSLIFNFAFNPEMLRQFR
ncbi:MAG: CD225/dispanin family protein [Ahniella sp.]|nr:CD225/dispanin family protein [Ahniella sp.]